MMVLLIAGMALWSLIHFSRSLVPNVRSQLISKMGLKGYKGIYALVVVASLVLMVLGWKSASVDLLYPPASFARHITALLMFFAMVLFFAGRIPTNIKRKLRHPQLSGVALWSLAHLLSNGEMRSVVLFVGMGAWALVQMGLINRREGAWHRPDKFSSTGDIRLAVIAVSVYALFVLFLHQYLFGVRPY